MVTKIEDVRIEKRVWGPGDTYLVVPEIQVFSTDGFKKGMKVRVIIQKLDK